MDISSNVDIQQVIAQAIATANDELKKQNIPDSQGVRTRTKADDTTSDQLPANLNILITVVTTAVLTAVNASLPALVNAVQNQKYDEKINKMKCKFQEKVLDNKYDNDRLEQYGRRESIRIAGVPENENENNNTSITRQNVIDTLKKIDVEIDHDSISASHRIGKKNSRYHRNIICKFVSRQPKELVMVNRFKLKNTDIYINEDLTPLRSKLLNYVKKKVPNVNQKSVHSIGGKIACKFTNDQENKWHHFETPKDLLASTFGPDNIDYNELGLADYIFEFSEE